MLITKKLLLLLIILLSLASCPSEPDPAKPVGPVMTVYSPNTQRLFNFLTDQYSQKILSGQMDTSWTTNKSMDMIARIYTDTGKYPAIKGFDLIQLPYAGSPHYAGKEQIDEAIEWWEGKNNSTKLLPDKPDIHGIITFCWHWRTGSKRDFYTNNTDFRIPMKNKKLDRESNEFKTITADLDKVAALFKLLKDKDIPVLWRPLHEAAGNYQYGQQGWFWWGASGPEAYIALWEYMYDYLVNTKGLNNLIWVWNGQHAEWFPNSDTVDIIGFDVYASPAQNYSSQKIYYENTLDMVGGGYRMVAMTENGAIPDPDNCKNDNAMWLWFLTWNDGSGSSQGQTGSNNFWTGEYHNTQAHKNKVYNHELVITLDELPDLTAYRQ